MEGEKEMSFEDLMMRVYDAVAPFVFAVLFTLFVVSSAVLVMAMICWAFQ